MDKLPLQGEDMYASNPDARRFLSNEIQTLISEISKPLHQPLEKGVISDVQPSQLSTSNEGNSDDVKMCLQLLQNLTLIVESTRTRLTEIDRKCTDIQAKVDDLQLLMSVSKNTDEPAEVALHQKQDPMHGPDRNAKSTKATHPVSTNAAIQEGDTFIYNLGGSDNETNEQSMGLDQLQSPEVGVNSNIKYIDLEEEMLLQGGSANYRKIHGSKPRRRQPATTQNIKGKKLFVTPPSSKRRKKVSQTVVNTSNDENLGGRQQTQLTRPHSIKGSRLLKQKEGEVLPQELKCKFRPTKTMLLSMDECKLCLYVFGYELNDSELLFKHGDIRLSRLHFQCLIPKKEVHQDILMLTALRITWTQQNSGDVNTWCLPPAYGEEVLMLSDQESFTRFANKWMTPSKNLKYIYVPLRDDIFYWYLMVVSIDECKIYQLDSNLDEGRLISKNFQMSVVCDRLQHALASEYQYTGVLANKPKLDKWPIAKSKNVPRCASIRSHLWVIEWMDMEFAFQPNVISQIDDNAVRMRALLNNLLGPHNEMKQMVQARAEARWNALLLC